MRIKGQETRLTLQEHHDDDDGGGGDDELQTLRRSSLLTPMAERSPVCCVDTLTPMALIMDSNTFGHLNH